MHTFAAYERNTGSRHPLDTLSNSSSVNQFKRASSNTIALDYKRPSFWFGEITIGTPSQSFRGKTSPTGFGSSS